MWNVSVIVCLTSIVFILSVFLYLYNTHYQNVLNLFNINMLNANRCFNNSKKKLNKQKQKEIQKFINNICNDISKQVDRGELELTTYIQNYDIYKNHLYLIEKFFKKRKFTIHIFERNNVSVIEINWNKLKAFE